MTAYLPLEQKRDSRAADQGPATVAGAAQLFANRPEVIAQRSLQDGLNQSPRVEAQRELHHALNQGPRAVAQAKLAEARSSMAVEAQESVEERKKREDWYENFLLNGLCLGFVRIFEQYPEWLAAMWQALSSWNPLHGSMVAEILAALNQHIEGVMEFNDGLQHANMLEAVLLAQEAWNNMNEPDAALEDQEYKPSPVWVVGAVTGSTSDHDSVSMNDAEEDKTWNLDTDPDTRWGLVKNEIDRVIGDATGRFHIIIYHGGHEMAVQYSRSDDEARTERWTVSETNAAGIVACESWDEVGALIGEQLKNAEGSFGVEVKRQTPLDSGSLT